MDEDATCRDFRQVRETRSFIERAFRDGAIQSTGTAITQVLPPASRFLSDGGHGKKKQRVTARFTDFFDRFFNFSTGGDSCSNG